MNEQERYLLERSHEELRFAITLLPDKKDPRITLIREFLGAEEEGAALDVLLVVGNAQEASDEFWVAAGRAGSTLDAQGDSPWLSPQAQNLWLTKAASA